MEHEVFVPVSARAVRETLGDPARVARCVPGLQRDADADAGPLAGRLKVRVDGHTITYRGALRIAESVSGVDGADEVGGVGGFTVEGEGTEARGAGSVKLALTLAVADAEGGATLTFTGTAHGDGRVAELADAVALAAAHRLLDKFAGALGVEAEGAEAHWADARAAADPVVADDPVAAAEEAAAGDGGGYGGEEEFRAEDGAAADEADGADGTGGGDEYDADAADDADEADDVLDGPDGTGSVFEVPVPPPSLDPLTDAEFASLSEPGFAEAGVSESLPAEAAHARRTMIGRSAEEVDHAPPRGRYAPVPAPESVTASATLRWIAPAAALAVASAVVVGRVLRRRR
ncbi:carbon monoxide dehydrogenase [Streptomyces sp. NPDC050504]|uniref:carbon monoxide dehydrogenase n=1 Tax=Streptomyces sp. NPDC050504 TaxID=3365618 RepID=UPI0037B46D22